jgi:hypothetical protein
VVLGETIRVAATAGLFDHEQGKMGWISHSGDFHNTV